MRHMLFPQFVQKYPQEPVAKEISFRQALAIAATTKESLDAIERLRGLELSVAGVKLQVDRDPKYRARRIYRLYGVAAQVAVASQMVA